MKVKVFFKCSCKAEVNAQISLEGYNSGRVTAYCDKCVKPYNAMAIKDYTDNTFTEIESVTIDIRPLY